MSKIEKVALIVSLTLVMLFAVTTFASASTVNPGVTFGNWIVKNAQGLFIGILAIAAIYLALKRQFMVLIMVLLFGGIAGILLFNGAAFIQKISDLISSWF